MKKNNLLIDVKNIRKEYKVEKASIFSKKNESLKAVDGVNLEIYEGEVLGLVGESGCGKSTLGQIITNIIPSTSGEIIYRGRDITALSKSEKKDMRKKVQIIFQDPYSCLNPKKTIGWIIEEPLKIHFNLSKEERDKKVDEMLKIVGLDESYKDRYPSEMSGGQRQRVSIASALILNPEFVVADECVSALDVSIQAQILNLLKNLQKERNLTYLFISHDLNVVQYISDRIGVMYLGKIVELGNADDIYNHPVHPYTKALFSAIPSIADERAQKIELKGEVPSAIDPPKGCAFHTRCPMAEEICRKSCPELRRMDDGREVRCHFAEKM